MQNFEKVNQEIEKKFLNALPKIDINRRLNLSWSNWGFGQEKLMMSVRRLAKFGVKFIELHGNRYGEDLGYNSSEVKKILDGEGLKVAGICGMFSRENDLSSVSGIHRQHAIDYIRRNLELGASLGAKYMLIVPGAVGRPEPYDRYEFHRSVETLRRVAHVFEETEIVGAIEPIRSAEVSFCHTFKEAKDYIEAVDHPWISKINGDIYHMLTEEDHIAETILEYGGYLINLHMADTNRRALGKGMMDLDTILMALYLIGYNNGSCFCTPEPLGPGGDPYPAMHGIPDESVLDWLVEDTVQYFRAREEAILER
ncbi:MAG TPA: sugar phosphate isomerase/epimerase [Candidatus Omnitrophica bacterium]|nr:sugar phosphate isomerase/epimerase [Candidatus Omnitrophota bacterium]